MDISAFTSEEHHQRSNSATSVSKSASSLVQIDSISIDLDIEMKKNEAAKCQHFSIRGFVTEMRKKDTKMCSPFALDGDSRPMEEHLPPLYVAKFRWWRCQNCLKEIGATSASEEIGFQSKCCANGIISDSCAHLLSHDIVATIPTDMQQVSNLNNLNGSKVDVNTSVNRFGGKYHLNACDYKHGKKTEIGSHAIADNGYDSKNKGDPEIAKFSCTARNFHSFSLEERQVDDPVILKSKRNGLKEFSEPHREIAESFHSPGCNSEGIFLVEKLISGPEQRHASQSSPSANKDINVKNMLSFELSSFELKEHDDESSESDETTGNTQRRTRKVRLLTELLNGKKSVGNEYKMSEKVSFDMRGDTPFGNDSQIEMTRHGNNERTNRSPQRKRKMPHLEECKQQEANCINNLTKNFRTVEAEEESFMQAIEISDSDMEGNIDAAVGLQTGVNRQRLKDGISKSTKMSKKKNKESQVADGNFFVIPQREVPKGNLDKYFAIASSSQARPDAFVDGGIESHFKSQLYSQQTERKSSQWKKKNKMVDFEDGQSSLMLSTDKLSGEELNKRKDTKFLHFYSSKLNNQPRYDTSEKMALDLSLNSFIDSERRGDRNVHGHVEDEIDLMRQKKSVPYQEFFPKDYFHFGESSFFHKSTPDSSLKKVSPCDPDERVAHRTSVHHKRQIYSSRLKEKNSPIDKNLDYSHMHNKERAVAVHDQSDTVLKHDDQGGTSDDIPMEIVELMAKNQYERGLYESDKNYRISEKFNGKGNPEFIGFPTGRSSEEMRALDKELPGMRKSTLSNLRNGMVAASENGANRSHLVNFSHINRNPLYMGQPEENTGFTMLPAFSYVQQNQTGGFQFSTPNSIRNRTAQNCEWNGGKLSERLSLTSMPILDTLNVCHSSSRQNDVGDFWSSVTPNHMPFNISQNCAAQSNNTERHAQHADTLRKGKIIRDFDLNSSNLNPTVGEIQNDNLDGEPFKGAAVEHSIVSEDKGTELNPVGMEPLDPSCNESIPAMQLLSLMDARMSSNIPFNLDAKKLLEKPFFPCDYHPKVSVNGKINFLEKTLLPNHIPSKAFSGAGPAVQKRSDPRSSPSVYLNRYNPSENFCKCSPADPSVPPLTMLAPTRHVLKGVNGLTGQLNFRSLEQDKGKRNYAAVQSRGRKVQKFLSPTSGSSSRNRDYNSHVDKQKEIPGFSDSVVFPLQSNGVENSVKHKEFQGRNMHGTVSPKKSIHKNPTCHLNQNPAEFTIPHERNVYTIGREMLLGKIPLKRRPAWANTDAQKRQRKPKLPTIKERGSHRA